MARQVTGQVPGWAGMLDGAPAGPGAPSWAGTSDGAPAGPRALSWAELGSWALDGGGMEVDWGHYSLFVVLSGP